jgi:hypothetical protein
MANEFNQSIPKEVQARIQAHLDGLRKELAPYLITLSPKERKNRLKMADKTVAFVQKVADYAASTPSLVPAFVDMTELRQDTEAVTVLTPFRQQLEQLTTDTDSTIMVAGGEALGNALTVFGNMKFMAKNKQPGAQVAYDDCKVRYPGNSRAKKPTPPAES